MLVTEVINILQGNKIITFDGLFYWTGAYKLICNFIVFGSIPILNSKIKLK